MLWNTSGEPTVLPQLSGLRALQLVPDAQTIGGSCEADCTLTPGALFKWTAIGGLEVYPTERGLRIVSMASDGSAAVTLLPTAGSMDDLRCLRCGDRIVDRRAVSR